VSVAHEGDAMARSTPCVEDGVLRLAHGDRVVALRVGEPAWFAWLADATAFAYAGPEGHFTARREAVGQGRGGRYWKAYRQRNGRLHRAYLGCSENLTPARLAATAAVLAARVDGDAASPGGHAPRRPAPPSVAAPPLPRALTSFVGRESELVEARTLLGQTRLLTLTGAGGVGKTRLALEAARTVQADYPDGAWLVELAALADAALVPQAVAQVLGVVEQPGRPLTATLAAWVGDRAMLLVMDNCEHLLDACAELAEALLRACAGLTILATSREPLAVPGEVTWRVPSLSIPDRQGERHPADLSAVPAVALFLARARAARPNFVLDTATAPAVAQICRRLDGLPLAIELAAARLRALSVDEIAGRLDDGFRLLTGGSRVALPRQQTLRATIDWSHDLLSEPERALLRRLAVFAGGWTLAAAEAVGIGEDVPAAAVLDLLMRLVDRSLVQINAGLGGETRYRLLETVRQYAAERLAESGEEAAAREQHADYFVGLAEQIEPHLEGRDLATWLDALQREHDNLRAALHWLHEIGDAERGLRLAGALRFFWYLRGHLTEGRERIAAFVGLAAPLAVASLLTARAKALDAAGFLARFQGDFAAALPMIEECLALRRQLGDSQAIADALSNLAHVQVQQGQFAAAQVLYQESLATNRATGNQQGIADAFTNVGLIAYYQGDLAMARSLHQQSLTIWRALGDGQAIGWVLSKLGDVALAEDDDRGAHTLFCESLTTRWGIGDRYGLAEALHGFAMLAAARRQAARALTLAGAAAALAEATRIDGGPVRRNLVEQWLQRARQALSADEAAAAWAAGQALTLDQAVVVALADEPAVMVATTPTGTTPLDPAGLTRREVEVLRLLAQGTPDRAIAKDLSISVKTVHKHVASILGKTGCANRTAAAAFALRHGLTEGDPAVA
jgi:non-specific serine/threonine protein kinase